MSIIHQEKRFKGLAVSPGVAYSKICLFNEFQHNNLPDYRIEDYEIEKEKGRFLQAVQLVVRQIDKYIQDISNKVGKSEAEIFVAHKMILEDPSLNRLILKHITTDKTNAETAVNNGFNYFQDRMLSLNNEYIKEKANDINELKRRVIDALSDINPSLQCAGEDHCQRGKNRVVIAVELTPSLTMEVDSEYVKGFVTEKGGVASHAAILARALNIPAVSAIHDIYGQILCGTHLLIDGNKGEVIINPSLETLKDYPSLDDTKEVNALVSDPVSEVKVLANISSIKDLDDVKKSKAEGIGLYRTEFEFFAEGRVLNENEQFEKYYHVVKEMEDAPVYFRLLDIGGDKNAPFFNVPKEENPYLGFRGARFLLGNEELFATQARALARAAVESDIYVMYPMIVEKEQFLLLKQKFMEATKDIKAKSIYHGVMFEVPSACFQASELLEVVDFASIGSNDLVQYFFAVDRNNELVAHDYNPDKEVFWRLISSIVGEAQKKNTPLSICGEIASDAKYLKKLLEIGIKIVSVSPKLISNLRYSINNKEKS